MIAAGLKYLLEDARPDEQVHVIVAANSIDKAALADLMVRPGYSLRQIVRSYPAVSLALPASDVPGLAEEPWVAAVGPDHTVAACAERSVPQVEVPPLRESGLSGSGVRLGILDTGIDKKHPDLGGRVAASADFTLEGGMDGSGHGTHSAALATGDGQAFRGRYEGIAPGATLLIAKVLRSTGTGMMSDVMAGLEWVTDVGADVVLISLATRGHVDGDDPLAEMCNRIAGSGVVVIAPAGNQGPDRRTVGSPGSAKQVICVGACNLNEEVPDFSSRGPTEGGRMKPDVLAPGVEVVSARAHGSNIGKPIGMDYTALTGTSVAAAHVAGICCLMREAKADCSPALVYEALTSTAKHLAFGEWVQGSGLVQANAAVEYVRIRDNPTEARVKPLGPNFMTAAHDLAEQVKGLFAPKNQ